MMRKVALLLCLAAAALFAAADGKWNAEFKSTSKKKGTETTRIVALDLHAAQGALTGTVRSEGKKARPLAIQNGKIDGDRISFTTVQTGKKGDQTYTWEGTVQGDQITGDQRDGAKRGQSFVARRQG
jgi:hypothetical protein